MESTMEINAAPLYPSLLGSALIDKHLQISKKECLEDASHDFSDDDGRLDEPTAAAGDRVSTRGTEERSDDKAQRPNRILKAPFDRTGKKLRLDNHQRRNLAKRGDPRVAATSALRTPQMRRGFSDQAR
jgi:hypothetical protein